MTSPARIGMLIAVKRAREHAAAVAARQAELYLALPEEQRAEFLHHVAEQNTPEKIRARAQRAARLRRQRAAYVRQHFPDISAFEAQFAARGPADR